MQVDLKVDLKMDIDVIQYEEEPQGGLDPKTYSNKQNDSFR